MRAILDALREKDSRGRLVALSGEELAQRAGNAMTGQNDIADAVRRLRERTQTAMLEQANVQCGRQDVITNDRRYGYRLSSKITVRDAADVGKDPSDAGNAQNDVKNLNPRQEWILDDLAAKGEMRKDEVFQGYKKQFGRSKTTLKRDLEDLRQHGLIRFEGEKRTGRRRRV